MITSFREVPKSPTREQQMQPEFISRISIPDSFRKPPSMPISPNSFSIRTTCSPFNASDSNFLINVVFPAPRKPDIISIFVIIKFLLFFKLENDQKGLFHNSPCYSEVQFLKWYVPFRQFLFSIQHKCYQTVNIFRFVSNYFQFRNLTIGENIS